MLAAGGSAPGELVATSSQPAGSAGRVSQQGQPAGSPNTVRVWATSSWIWATSGAMSG
jgi:hypothetical protein